MGLSRAPSSLLIFLSIQWFTVWICKGQVWQPINWTERRGLPYGVQGNTLILILCNNRHDRKVANVQNSEWHAGHHQYNGVVGKLQSAWRFLTNQAACKHQWETYRHHDCSQEVPRFASAEATSQKGKGQFIAAVTDYRTREAVGELTDDQYQSGLSPSHFCHFEHKYKGVRKYHSPEKIVQHVPHSAGEFPCGRRLIASICCLVHGLFWRCRNRLWARHFIYFHKWVRSCEELYTEHSSTYWTVRPARSYNAQTFHQCCLWLHACSGWKFLGNRWTLSRATMNQGNCFQESLLAKKGGIRFSMILLQLLSCVPMGIGLELCMSLLDCSK